MREGIPGPGGVWADFGSGTGAFTLALAELVGPSAQIYSIDKEAGSLRRQERAFREQFPGQSIDNLHFIASDFSRSIDLPPLDGAIMANALHFQREKNPVIEILYNYLRPGGRLILVEYNVDHGNLWVPYPISFWNWVKLADRHGFVDTRLLGTRPSRFLKEIYSAISIKPAI